MSALNPGTKLALAAGGVAVLIGTFVNHTPPPVAGPASGTAVADASERSVAAEFAQLKHELARTQSMLLAERQARREATTIAQPKPTTIVEHDEPVEPALDGAGMRDELDAKFSADTHDARWSRPAEESARALLTNDLPETARLYSLECKATLCRAEIGQPSADAHRAYLEQFLTRAPQPWTGPLLASLVEDPSGSFATVVFLARGGTEL